MSPDSEVEKAKPHPFVVGEGFGNQGPKQPHHTRECWEVVRFLKNMGYLFYASTNPEVMLE